MRKILKPLLWLFGILLVLVLTVTVTLASLDPNDYKGWLSQQFQERTGRSLSLAGDLSLTYYPWLGVEANDVTIGNAEGFGDQPFFHTDYAKLRIKLLPLLQEQYEIDTVVVHGLVLNLAVDKDGRSNWADLAGGEEKEGGQLPLAAVVLGGVDVQNAAISYDNRASGARYDIRKLNASTGELTYGDPVDLKLSLEAESRQPELAADLELSGTVNYDLGGQRYEVKPLQLTSNVRSARLPGGKTRMELDTAVQVDMNADTAGINDLVLKALDTTVKGSLQAGRVTTPTPTVKAHIAVDGSDLSLPFRLLEVEPLASQLASLDRRAFTFSTGIDADMKRGDVDVSGLKAHLLGADISGDLKARNIQSDTPGLRGELAASGPDLPTLMQVVGQVQGGKDAALAQYGRKLQAVSAPAFDVKSTFDADLKSGDIDVPSLDIDTLGIKVKGNLKARNMQEASGTMQGHLSLDSTRTGELLSALDKKDLGQVVQSLQLDAAVSGSRTDLNLKPLSLKTRLAGKDIPNSPVDVSLNAATRLNLEKGRLDVDAFSLNGLGLDVKGRLSASDIQEAPAFNGTVAVAPFNLRKLMQQLNKEPPETADKKALSKVALSTSFDGSAGHLNLDKLDLTLDATRITGKAGVTDFEKKALQANISIDQINLDDYLPPEAQNKPATPETAAGAAAQLPVETLRSLNARVDLKAGKMVVSNLRLADLVLHLEGKDGRIKLDPMSAKLYQGSYSGHINLDASGKLPKLAMKSTLKGVEMEPLLKDMSETGEAQLKGTSNIGMNVTASGNSTDAMKKNLNGNIELRVNNGVLMGVDVRKVLEQAEIIIESKRLTKIDRGEQTPFDQMTATMDIKSGVVRNNDLLITSPGFQITGKGMVANLRNDSINYDMKVDVIKESATRGEERYNIGGYSIPIHCRGRMQEPDCKPDYGGLLKEAVRQAGKEKLQEVLEKAMGVKKQPADSQTQPQQTQPQQTQPQQTQPQQEQQPKDPEKALEDALKEGLKGLFK